MSLARSATRLPLGKQTQCVSFPLKWSSLYQPLFLMYSYIRRTLDITTIYGKAPPWLWIPSGHHETTAKAMKVCKDCLLGCKPKQRKGYLLTPQTGLAETPHRCGHSRASRPPPQCHTQKGHVAAGIPRLQRQHLSLSLLQPTNPVTSNKPPNFSKTSIPKR